MEIKKAVCLHEEDAGLLWKHMDYRSGGCLAASTAACCRLVCEGTILSAGLRWPAAACLHYVGASSVYAAEQRLCHAWKSDMSHITKLRVPVACTSSSRLAAYSVLTCTFAPIKLPTCHLQAMQSRGAADAW